MPKKKSPPLVALPPPFKRPKFTNNDTHLPVTMDQFQNLTNEVLGAINEVCAPHFLDADYVAQILMSAIHALDHKYGYVTKSSLFESCINRISCHITYHAVQEIQTRLKGKQTAESPTADPVAEGMTASAEETVATAH